MYHNIDKSAFRRGQYIGYGAGIVWRIVRRAHDWYATPQSYGWYSGFAARTLQDISNKLSTMPVMVEDVG